MSLTDLIIRVFCLTDDLLRDMQASGIKLRARGPAPTLADSEVVTMELVGELIGLDEERAIFTYFRRHHTALFPKLAGLHRVSFTRQAANLWAVKEQLWQRLLDQVKHDEEVSIIDSFPMPVCRFARAKRCKRFAGEAAFGYDAIAKQTFYGFRAHVRIAWPGVIVACELAPANVHDLSMVNELTEQARGYLLGDRNYWSPDQRGTLAQRGLALLTPEKSRKREQKPWPLSLVQMRRRIETVFSQLVERYSAKKVWARDRWHLVSRWWRKVLSHTVAVLLCQQQGLSPLRFSELLTD